MHEHFQRHLWINIGIIAGSFLVFGAVFYFFSQALDGKVAKILADRTAIAQRSLDLETLNKLKTDTDKANEFQKKLDALLPPQDSLIGFPQFLNNLARTHSLSSNFNYDGAPVPASPASPGYVNFSATFEGEPDDILKFLTELETKTTRFMVNVLQLTYVPRSGGIFAAAISAKVYLQENRISATTP